MKKFASVVFLVIVISLFLGAVVAFAGSADMAEELIPGYGDIYDFSFEGSTDDEIGAMVEEIIGEGADELLPLVLASSFCILAFVPVLTVMIIFIVLNSKTKKRIREYENIYGPVPDNSQMLPNQYQNGGNAYGYGAYNTNSGAGQNYSVPSYIPQNNYPQENNQQGGQF